MVGKILLIVFHLLCIQTTGEQAPTSELWVGEAAAAWHSGRAGVTNRFTSSFWWSDALGALASHNHTSYCRQTMLGGSYGLLNRSTYEPNPDWYGPVHEALEPFWPHRHH